MSKAIIALYRDGISQRSISKRVGHDVKTIRRIIRLYEEKGTEENIYKKHSTLLDCYKAKIIEFIEQDLSNIRIFEEIQKAGYIGSYSSISAFTRKLKIDPKICVRFHTLPAEEAQVDFGDVGLLPDKDGKLRKAYVFNMRLSYSRLDYFEVVFDQKVETFMRCHINAFKYFNGVPQIVKIDNLKSAIVQASFYEPVYQNSYSSLADYYNFRIVPCRVRKPQEKGKVESGIKYVKNNFFAGRKFIDNKQLNYDLRHWLDTYCNTRIHGTTKEQPVILFRSNEASLLKNLPHEEFLIGQMTIRKVHSDCHIRIDNNYYSAPYQYVDKEVEVEITEALIKIYENSSQIAIHKRIHGKGAFSTISAHYPKYKYFTHDSVEYLEKSEKAMSSVGKHTAILFTRIVQENPHGWYRTIQGILSLRKIYSDDVLELACKRALHFSIIQYTKVKSICESGCYNLELSN